MDRIYPEKITWDNAQEYNYDLKTKHPNWVKAHFPLVLIYYRKEAGKLRNSKSLNVMYQNHKNVSTQLVKTADNFGILHRKNSHKGYKNIVAAFTLEKGEELPLYGDLVKPVKHINFSQVSQTLDPSCIKLKALCEVLEDNYLCNAKGQLKLI